MGEPVTYVVTFSNVGQGKASGVVITDAVPASVTVTGVISSGMAITDTGSAPPYVWSVQDLAPFEGGVITLTGVVSTGLSHNETFTNAVTIASTAVDTDTTNNTDALPIIALDIPIAGLAAAKPFSVIPAPQPSSR